jgi:hypothetical protein
MAQVAGRTKVWNSEGVPILTTGESVHAKCVIIYRDANRATARAVLEVLIGAPISDKMLDRGCIYITRQWDICDSQ